VTLTIRSAFDVVASRKATWALLTDIERAGPCFPGATVQGRNDDGSWRATFAVKLGPMSFAFAGRFNLVEVAEIAGRVLIKAQGSDTKGRGGAKADVEVQLSGTGSQTHVDIVSSVDLSGSVAQFGRGAGMIESLSKQLLQQFAANLQRELGTTVRAEPATEANTGTDSSLLPLAALPPLAPINALSLLWRSLLAAIRSWFARRDGPGRPT